MYNMSMLRHWFSNEWWGGGGGRLETPCSVMVCISRIYTGKFGDARER